VRDAAADEAVGQVRERPRRRVEDFDDVVADEADVPVVA